MQADNLAPDHLTKRGALIAAVKIDDVRRLARRLLRDEAVTTVRRRQAGGHHRGSLKVSHVVAQTCLPVSFRKAADVGLCVP